MQKTNSFSKRVRSDNYIVEFSEGDCIFQTIHYSALGHHSKLTGVLKQGYFQGKHGCQTPSLLLLLSCLDQTSRWNCQVFPLAQERYKKCAEIARVCKPSKAGDFWLTPHRPFLFGAPLRAENLLSALLLSQRGSGGALYYLSRRPNSQVQYQENSLPTDGSHTLQHLLYDKGDMLSFQTLTSFSLQIACPQAG